MHFHKAIVVRPPSLKNFSDENLVKSLSGHHEKRFDKGFSALSLHDVTRFLRKCIYKLFKYLIVLLHSVWGQFVKTSNRLKKITLY